MNRTQLPIILVGIAFTALPNSNFAGTYIFANETRPDVVTHPSGYDGVVDTANVQVCIVPGTPNAGAMEIPVRNAIDTLNLLVATEGNVRTGSDNPLSGGQIDFESVFIHELGHCTGLAHVNLASESGLSGADTNYTKSTNGANNSFDRGIGPDNVRGSADDLRGDDINLHWFFVGDNNPFALPTTPQAGSYSRNLADLPGADNFPVNADRTVSTVIFGLPETEGIMQQLTFGGETQRSLSADEVATFLHAQAGLDRQAGTADDYTMNLSYGGISDAASCDVNVAFDNAETGFAVCQTGARGLGSNNFVITSANTFYNTGSNWFYTPSRAPLPGVDNLTVAFGGSTDRLDGGAQSLLANDIDQAAGSPGLVMSSTTFFGGQSAANIILNSDGSFSYTHDGTSAGNDQFVYRVCLDDGAGGETDICAHQYVNVNVLSSGNNPPVAGDDSASVARGGQVNRLDSGQRSLLGNDSDPDMDSLTVSTSPVSGPANGMVQIQANGNFSYIHDGSLTSTDRFVYQVCDDGTPVTCANAEVTLNVDLAPAVCLSPAAGIPDNGAPNDTLTSTITLNSTDTLTDLNVVLNISHTFVGDLSASLSHEGAGATTRVLLLDRPGLPGVNANFGCGNDNIAVTLDDAANSGAEDQCSGTPAISGTHSPAEPLSQFNGETLQGQWLLEISDAALQDTGALESWCLDPTATGASNNPPLANDGIFADGFE